MNATTNPAAQTEATKPTAEEVAAAQAAADKAAFDKKVKEDAKAAKKAEAEAAKAEKKAASDAKKKAKEDAKAETAAKREAAIAEKAAAKAAKEANRQPEQNGVRRPGPDGKCGKAWAVFDELSNKMGQPVPIAEALAESRTQGMNDANVRCEYARWKKFHGIVGRVSKPAVEATPAEAAQAAAN